MVPTFTKTFWRMALSGACFGILDSILADPLAYEPDFKF